MEFKTVTPTVSPITAEIRLDIEIELVEGICVPSAYKHSLTCLILCAFGKILELDVGKILLTCDLAVGNNEFLREELNLLTAVTCIENRLGGNADHASRGIECSCDGSHIEEAHDCHVCAVDKNADTGRLQTTCILSATVPVPHVDTLHIFCGSGLLVHVVCFLDGSERSHCLNLVGDKL